MLLQHNVFQISCKEIYHNTLASSDYGWLKHGTFAHSRKDGKEGVAYLVINTSWTETFLQYILPLEEIRQQEVDNRMSTT